MSDYDVYEGEMPNRSLSDRDVEALLSGAVPEQQDLARFGGVLRSLHDTAPVKPSEEAVATFAAHAAELAVVPPGDEADPTPRNGPTRRLARGLHRKLAGGLAAAVVLAGMSGVAVAADGAHPGDLLYGLDRAMEAVGLGDGGPTERITEAQTLFNEGQVDEAIAHAAEAVKTTDGTAGETPDSFSPEASKAAEALFGAAKRVEKANGEVPPENVRAVVAGILSEIAAMLEAGDVAPSDFGNRISEMARLIGEGREGGGPEGPVQNPGRSNSEKPGSPDDAPGRPPANGRSGPPADVPSGPPAEVPGRGGRP